MTEIPKVYDPQTVEPRWYPVWLERGYFKASLDTQRPRYCIVIPPPNITGSLHLGHALNNTLQDILVRWKRMEGYNVLWVPGTDHAGIATQNVVERQLKEEWISREHLGREKFIKRVKQWREQSGRTIIEQLKRLGASCDWSRERFTLDEGLSSAVREVFVRLYNEGLIYRGERLINWCPRCQTALSDIEVEHEETQGKMYYIKYPLVDEPETFLTVATTRPETMLGDTAVAVHPEDPRYNKLIGRQVLLPLTNRKIPIVGDSILVDREFGTGAVKITPAEDFNDEKAGYRHGLPFISVFDEKARIRSLIQDVDQDVKGKIIMLSAQQAREQVVSFLNERGYLVKTEDHRHAIGKCYRCKSVVSPFLSPQWFVSVNVPHNSLAQPAIDAVRQKKVRLIPESWETSYYAWMENIQDWCISRQIWWGHQIPAWYCSNCNPMLHTHPDGTPIISKEAKPIVSRTDPTQCLTCKGTNLVRDPDVLDTWFSSALWPFSTLGWPKNTPELRLFYPTDTLVTSFDILFFWVARMIMMGLYCKPKPAEGKTKKETNDYTENIPFRDVYIHALVRDAEGQKMSKSKGNVIDPLGVMEKYGTDALRFTLAAMASPGRDIKLSEQRIEGYRNFANKIWNAARFVLMNLEGQSLDKKIGVPSLADRWIRVRLRECIHSVTHNLEVYRFDEAANQLYQFIWHEYCDWYLELIKPRLSAESPEATATRATMVNTLETLLRLLHPFMPFITEEIWQKIPHQGETIVLAPYPQPSSIKAEDKELENAMDGVIDIIRAIRTFRSESDISPTQHLRAGLIVTAEMTQLIRHHKLDADIQRLARISDLRIATHVNEIEFAPVSFPLVSQGGEILIDLRTVVGVFDPQERRSVTEKKLSSLEGELLLLQQQLEDQEFIRKAPSDVVAKKQSRRAELLGQKVKWTDLLTLFEKLMKIVDDSSS